MRVCEKDIMVRGRIVRIASPELDSYEILEDPKTIIQSLQKSGVRIDLFTFMQLMPETEPKYDYPMELDNLAVLPLSTFEHWRAQQVDNKIRNLVRKAEKKGVVVREVAFDEALVKGIWEVYNESPVRQGKRNVHYGKDIEMVRKEESTFLDRSIFIGAFLEEQLIGFVKLVTDEDRTQANLMNIVSMIRHRDRAPTNALIARSVQCCTERGMRYLLYQNFTYGRKKPDSLTDFKEANGFQRFDLPRYYVPLTLRGWLTLRLGLHHGVVNRLPEPMINRLIKIRKTWYNRKLQSESVHVQDEMTKPAGVVESVKLK